jgi:beta-galactosidase
MQWKTGQHTKNNDCALIITSSILKQYNQKAMNERTIVMCQVKQKNIKLYGFLVILFVCNAALAQKRIEQAINSNWQFYKGDKLDNVSTMKWENVSLPHSFNAHDVLDDEPGYYRGITWYKKNLFIPSSWKDKDVYLHFEGAAQVATVYINGKLVGTHIGSYAAFNFKINSYLNWNDGAADELTVQVDNRHNENIAPLSADFTFYGGIYRDVYLKVMNPVHFDAANYASKGLFITTPQVSEEKATVQVKGVVTNASSNERKLLVKHSISNKEGKIVAEEQTLITAKTNSQTAFETVLMNISKPNLWSIESPYLYKVSSVVMDANTKEVLDEQLNPLGFRWFEFTADKGFFLNGKHVKLWGASRHQDNGSIGNALPDALHVKDIQLLKDMGANFLRVAHYPQDPAVLEACDRLGIVASVETPIVNAITENDTFASTCLSMQVEMIRQHFNHPSVVIWAYMNEVLLRLRFSNDKPRQKIYIANVAKLAYSIDSISRVEDPTRYTMLPFHGDLDLYINAGMAKIPQIVGWNQYPGWYSEGINKFADNMEKHRRLLRDKPVIVTEFGADGDPRVRGFSPERFDKTLEYETYFHSYYIKAINDRPFIAGGAMWNLCDFNAEGRAESMPHINNKGLLTIERKPKDAYFYYQSQLLSRPFVKIGSSNWVLRSGIEDPDDKMVHTQQVQVFSNQKQVSMLLNGKSLGTVNAVDGIATFDVPFTNGENLLESIITVVGKIYKDEAEIKFMVVPYHLSSTKLPFKEINISLGDKRYITDEKLEQVWLPEQVYQKGSWGYVGGKVFMLKDSRRQPYGSDKNIFQTDLDPVYETQRVGIEQFKLDVPDGKYEVNLLFAELISNAIRDANIYNLDNGKSVEAQQFEERTFDISINGQKAIENLSNKNYLIPETAYNTKVIVDVKDGKGISIDFKAIKGETILNGLQVRKVF